MFRYPPSEWAKIGLKHRFTHVALALAMLFVAPLLWGSVTTGNAPGPGLNTANLIVPPVEREPGSSQSSALSGLRDALERAVKVRLVASAETAPAFVWPAYGGITSYMDDSHPMGIDIELGYESASPIAAAASGLVTFAGGGLYDSYGFFIVIDHGNGISTLYAHLDEFFVSQGDTVEQGQVIANGGSTGKSSGKHLHFEVRFGDYLADPLALLPAEPDAEPQSLECGPGLLMVERGGTAVLDFGDSLPVASKLTGATVNVTGAPSGHPAPSAEVTSDRTLTVHSPLLIGSTGWPVDDFYRVDVVAEGEERIERSCNLQVRTRDVALTPYAAASYMASLNSAPDAPEAVAPQAQAAEPPPPTETPVPPVPTEAPVLPAIPTNIPLLGALTSPTPVPATPTPTSTFTPTPTSTTSPTPAATATPSATPSPSPTMTLTPTPTATLQSTLP